MSTGRLLESLSGGFKRMSSGHLPESPSGGFKRMSSERLPESCGRGLVLVSVGDDATNGEGVLMVRDGWHSGGSKDTDRQTHSNETETETVTEDDSECGSDATNVGEKTTLSVD